MKKLLIFFGMFLTFLSFKANSQTFCFTPPNSSSINLYSSLLKRAQVEESYCLRIYVHVIRRSNGTGGQSIQDVSQALSFLDMDFNPHGISFVWNDIIDYIDNDSYYNFPAISIYNVNNHTDGIDIYLFDDQSDAGGRANGVGESSEFWISGSYWDEPYGSLVKSHVISHEMGHVLFLWHTHHGTYNEGGSDIGQCAELVDGSNSSSCGDYITDTPADPHLQFNVNHTNCTWNGSGTDANGDNYVPDETIIMAYTHPDCMSYFTNEQGQRMRNAIATLTFLQNTIVDCEPDCPNSLNITQNISSGVYEFLASNSITATNVISSGANVTYRAGNIVSLTSGFHSQAGSHFHAFNAPCSQESNSQTKGTLLNESENAFNESRLLIYPNPNKGNFKIELSGYTDEIISIEVTNILGAVVYKKENTLSGSVNINISEQPKGLYFVKTRVGDKVYTNKIIKR